MDPGNAIGMFLCGMVVGIALLGGLGPIGSNIIHLRIRTRRFDLEIVTGYGMSPGARCRFGDRIRARREAALPMEESDGTLRVP